MKILIVFTLVLIVGSFVLINSPILSGGPVGQVATAPDAEPRIATFAEAAALIPAAGTPAQQEPANVEPWPDFPEISAVLTANAEANNIDVDGCQVFAEIRNAERIMLRRLADDVRDIRRAQRFLADNTFDEAFDRFENIAYVFENENGKPPLSLEEFRAALDEIIDHNHALVAALESRTENAQLLMTVHEAMVQEASGGSDPCLALLDGQQGLIVEARRVNEALSTRAAVLADQAEADIREISRRRTLFALIR